MTAVVADSPLDRAPDRAAEVLDKADWVYKDSGRLGVAIAPYWLPPKRIVPPAPQ